MSVYEPGLRRAGSLDPGASEALAPFLLASLAVHVLLLWFWQTWPAAAALPPAAPLPEPPVLTLVPPESPPEKQLVDTTGLPETERGPEETARVSTRNTPATDPESEGRIESEGLPKLAGDTEALTLGMSNPAPAAPSPPTMPSPRPQPLQPPAAEPAPRPAPEPEEAAAPPEATPPEFGPRPVGPAEAPSAPRPGRTLEPTPREPKTPRVEVVPSRPEEPGETPAAAPMPARPAPRPPSPSPSEPVRAELASGIGRDLGRMKESEESKVPKGGEVSLATREEDYARYLKTVRKRVQLSWVLGHGMDPRLVYQTRDGEPVVIEFAIRPDGGLAQVKIVENAGNAFLAGAIKKSIMLAAPFPKFSEFEVHETELGIRFRFYTD
jgi:hypothetical protein